MCWTWFGRRLCGWLGFRRGSFSLRLRLGLLRSSDLSLRLLFRLLLLLLELRRLLASALNLLQSLSLLFLSTLLCSFGCGVHLPRMNRFDVLEL